MQILLRWVVGTLALWLTVLLGQQFKMAISLNPNPLYAFAAVLALALANAVVRPIVKFLTIPLNCLTLGLFNFVINAALFWGVSFFLPVGLRVADWKAALFGSVVFTIASGLLNLFINEKTVPVGRRRQSERR